MELEDWEVNRRSQTKYLDLRSPVVVRDQAIVGRKGIPTVTTGVVTTRTWHHAGENES